MSFVLGGPQCGKTTHLINAYRHALTGGFSPDQILFPSFFAANAASIRQALQAEVAGPLTWVMPIQNLQRRLLAENALRANLAPRPQEISAPARLLVLRQAWQQVNGSLHETYGTWPGALSELARVIDWLSQKRRGFRISPGELSAQEISATYSRFITLCAERRLLTFQESSLRCLDLLNDPEFAGTLQERFPVILVDDLHLARPDQITLIQRLVGPQTQFTASAWLSDTAHVPELNYVRTALEQWGPGELLPAPSSDWVNPAITTAVNRLLGTPAPEAAISNPILLSTPFTVEDELQEIASRMVRLLLDDPTLPPSEIMVAAADTNLIGLAARVLNQYGLPVAQAGLSFRHTPLVRGGLLVMRSLLQAKSDLTVETALLQLPFIAVNPLDLQLLRLAAIRSKTGLVDLSINNLSEKLSDPETLPKLEMVRAALKARRGQALTAELLNAVMSDLGGLNWIWADQTFSRSQGDAWSRAWVRWVSGIQELEETLGDSELADSDRAVLINGLADQTLDTADPDGIRLISMSETNGQSARCSFVIGLSENATPILKPELQLLPESELPGLFADGRAVVLPKARDQAAWLEREGRSLAALLSRGREHLHVSVSHYTVAGDAQLPSPFFERLLGHEGEIDREGNLTLTRPGIWEQTHPDISSPERLIPLLVGDQQSRQAETSQPLLDQHTYSASQLKMYLTCPLQFFYGRVLRIEAEGASFFERGSFVHELLCATLGNGQLTAVDLRTRQQPGWLNSAARLEARAQAALTAAWTGEGVDLPGGGHYQPSLVWQERFGPRLQREATRRWASGLLSEWADFEVEGLPDREARRPILLEMNFTLELQGFRLTGRIDRIDEIQTKAGPVYEVVDYKTGSSSTGSVAAHVAHFLPEAEDEPSDYQLPLYALALHQVLGELKALPRTLRYINVESLERTSRGKLPAAATRAFEIRDGGVLDRKVGQIPITLLQTEVTNGIVATLAKMSATPYSAQPGFHCQYCGFRAACDRGQAQGSEAA